MILLVQVMKKMTDMINEKRECQGDLNLPPREETENLRKVNIDSAIFLTGHASDSFTFCIRVKLNQQLSDGYKK